MASGQNTIADYFCSAAGLLRMRIAAPTSGGLLRTPGIHINTPSSKSFRTMLHSHSTHLNLVTPPLSCNLKGSPSSFLVLGNARQTTQVRESNHLAMLTRQSPGINSPRCSCSSSFPSSFQICSFISCRFRRYHRLTSTVRPSLRIPVSSLFSGSVTSRESR